VCSRWPPPWWRHASSRRAHARLTPKVFGR
jgi:hypothetical protein